VSYTKFHEAWENDPSTDTPITAEALDHIEEGIQTAARGGNYYGTDYTVGGVTNAELVYPVAAGEADAVVVRFAGSAAGSVAEMSAPAYGPGTRMTVRNINTVGTITVKHLLFGTSPSFYLSGGVDAVMAYDDHMEFYYESGFWIECGRSFETPDDAAVEARVDALEAFPAWQVVFPALANEPPASAFATLDTRNSHPVLDFDAGTDESAVFRGVLPSAYAGGGLNVKLIWAATSATAGNVLWYVGMERIPAGSLDIDADSFGTGNSSVVATDSVSGETTETTITLSSGAQMDSTAAGEMFRLVVIRDANNASDTMTGDAELLAVVVTEQ
jgi:hypothetical protein